MLNLNFIWTCCLRCGEYFDIYGLLSDAENRVFEWFFGLSVLFPYVKTIDILYLQFLDLHTHPYNHNYKSILIQDLKFVATLIY